MHFLRRYPTCDEGSYLWQIDTKTYRLHIWRLIILIAIKFNTISLWDCESFIFPISLIIDATDQKMRFKDYITLEKVRNIQSSTKLEFISVLEK
jgi:hypothetical protein